MIVWLEDTNVHSVLAEPALGKGGYLILRSIAILDSDWSMPK